ncbi:FadR family transcriptional regulator [Pendulispora rubella]|uniref:FadR family transcriptional regulator n=1 Tax=Pendulispora rubella TaxID=2741070 RepID=A0ABZ2LCA8_9BACT
MQQTRPGARANQQALQESIKKLIVERKLEPGSPLPTEFELMSELGVSRHPLREAMKALEALGIVDIRHGYGTYVGSVSLAGLETGLTFRTARSLKSDLSDIRDLLELREVLESGLVQRVVAAYDRADFVGLEECVAAMEARAHRGEYAPDADWRFHETLYRPLGNELILDLLRVFWRVFHALEEELPVADWSPEMVARWHRTILTALRHRDEAGLRAAIDEHFRGIRVRVG